MKTKCYLCIACSLLTSSFLQTANAQANTQLSNLVSPTKVNQNLLPNTDNTRNLGSGTRAWKDIYLDGSLYLTGLRLLSNGGNVFGFNVFIGGSAGLNTTTGIDNTAGGHVALFKNTTGNKNTAFGFGSLYSNTIGYDNTANGFEALNSNTFGEGNTANGTLALYSNTTGNYNTANGHQALYSNTFGTANTANGTGALYHNTGGSSNTANGLNALFVNTTGNGNTANGAEAGSYNDNNIYCTFLGNDADQSVTTDFINSTALGNISRITASNQVRIGNSSVTSIGGYEPWTNLSDGRFKKNVKENVPGLAFINQLHAITYTIDVTNLRNFLGEDRKNETMAEGRRVSEKNPEAEALIQKGIQEKEKIIRTGFVAQEVDEAAKRIGYDFSGVDKPANEHTPYGLRYSEFVVPLVKAVQELSKINDEKDARINNLQKQIDELKAIVFNQNNISPLAKTNPELNNASLIQNVPNPFANATTIKYTLPIKFTSAQIIITDKDGKQLKQLNISGSSKGALCVEASTLSSGTYHYSLVIDGKIISTKQMVVVK